MKIAYADPPYIGQANRYIEKEEVDHRALILRLNGYDGWALSCSSPSLFEICSIINDLKIPKPRIGSWVKSFCSFKPNVNPAYAWEAIIFKPARGYERETPTRLDWVKGNITLQKGLVGAKPFYFSTWLFEILGADCDDEFFDMFPGTGAVTKAWEGWSKCRQFGRWLKVGG